MTNKSPSLPRRIVGAGPFCKGDREGFESYRRYVRNRRIRSYKRAN